MSSLRVEVAPAVLQWAVDRVGQREALERKFPKLAEWLAGQSQPTFKQLEAFAKATLAPFGYFFLPEPPKGKLPIPHFRTLNGHETRRPSVELLETVYMMQRRQAWMRDYLIEQGEEPLPFVGSARPTTAPESVAQSIRETLNLSADWARPLSTWTEALRWLERRMEDVGILVVVNGILGNNTRRPLNVEEFRGFVLVDEYAPLVFVNGADAKAAQMFTLAHELAHIWFGKSAAFDLRQLQPASDDLEQTCNRVAAEFLVPADRLRDAWRTARDAPDRFQALARTFKVSELVVARRALDLRMIRREEFFQFYEQSLQRERRRERAVRGGNFYATQNLRVGRRFAQAVAHAVGEGSLLYRDAYHLTGLYGDAFEKFMASLRTTEAT